MSENEEENSARYPPGFAGWIDSQEQASDSYGTFVGGVERDTVIQENYFVQLSMLQKGGLINFGMQL